MRKVFMYTHGGSKNHGCEALIRSTCQILKDNTDYDINLISMRKKEDEFYGLNNITKIYDDSQKPRRFGIKYFIVQFFHYILRRDIFDSVSHKVRYKNVEENDICLSVGGDNYCYNKGRQLQEYNVNFKKKKAKTVLWGCSIEPNDIDDIMKNDLLGYSLITARETITYNALKQFHPNTKLFPDSAFLLSATELPLPEGFAKNNTVGINISPLIITKETVPGTTMKNYENLINHIISTTDMQVALIPHVIWEHDNDLEPITDLYNKFKDTKRVIMIGDHNCMELKGFIKRCRLFIGARTHATVAAYSSCVPSLVVGYSVKAKGIAKDIFGEYENYVIPVQTLKNENELIEAFTWLENNESSIRSHLQKFMPEYCSRISAAGKELVKL